MNLSTPIAKLTGVGSKLAKILNKLGLVTAQDLLLYFPFRYEDYRNIVQINDLRAKESESVTVQAKITMIKNRRGWKKQRFITEAIVEDETGSLRVVWFNQGFLLKVLKPGDLVNLSGKVKVDMLGPQLVAPVYEKVKLGEKQKEQLGSQTHTARLVPIYPLTDGITQKQIRFLISQVINLADSLEEWIPDEIMEAQDLINLAAAVRGVHFPQDEIELEQALKRLKFGEIFNLQLKGEWARRKRQLEKAPVIKFNQTAIKDFVSSLPFKLTNAQRAAAWEVMQDLEKPIPMNRIVSGDVGSGKTMVAALALYSTALNKYQGLFLAPTEILATQHFLSLIKTFGKKVRIALYTRAKILLFDKDYLKFDDTKTEGIKISKKELLEKILKEEVDIVVGTHALLSEKIKFKNLALVVVDEQHRFGVEQRKDLKSKAPKDLSLHFLSMTATPIPRSLALALYGDLDLSIIDEMPPGRQSIITRLVAAEKRGKAYDFIKNKIKEGRQVFVICPLVQEKDDNKIKNNISVAAAKKTVMSEYKKLSEEIFPEFKVNYLYGKLKDKDKVMRDFKEKKFDILVSTSVVEVGVDVPNAAIIMIEGAENFGLAQLHQFRGRVGRGEYQSYCFLFTQTENEDSLTRLHYFEQINNGFKLAEEDLQMRGPGEVYGTKQSGGVRLKLARLSDRELIKIARFSARQVFDNSQIFSKLKDRLERLSLSVHLE